MKGFLSMLFAVAFTANAFSSVPTIDIHKIKATELLTGPYSYFVPPYNYYYFQHMDKLDFQFDWIRHGNAVYSLQEPKQSFTINYTYKKHNYSLDQYFKRNAVLGFLILKDNQIIYERYFHDANQQTRFLSNSVGKSITSTLIGIALEEKKINSINDPVIEYLPELSDSGFNRVTIKQALMMATGVDLSYDPHDLNSSTHRFNSANLTGVPSFSNLLKSVKANPKIKPGTVFDYENENSEVLGFIIEKTTGMPYNKYLQDKIWNKMGTQSDAFLYRAKAQPDQCAFGCLSATLRDYGRFGLMMMSGGTLGGKRIVGTSWVKEATTPEKFSNSADESQGLGYGYQWWIPVNDSDHTFKAMGIFGQIIYVNPTKHLVIVQTAAWPIPEDNNRWDESTKVMDAIANNIN